MVFYNRFETPIIAAVVGFVLLAILGVAVWYKMKGFVSHKEGAIVPQTDPTKINKYRRATQAHKFRQQSRYKSSLKKKTPVQFSKLQAIYETEIVNSIDEIDVENQADMVVDFNDTNFQSKGSLYKMKIETCNTDENITIYNSNASDDDSTHGSTKDANMSKRGSFSTSSVYNTPRRSRTSSAMDVEDEKLEDITNVTEYNSDRSFRFLSSR